MGKVCNSSTEIFQRFVDETHGIEKKFQVDNDSKLKNIYFDTTVVKHNENGILKIRVEDAQERLLLSEVFISDLDKDSSFKSAQSFELEAKKTYKLIMETNNGLRLDFKNIKIEVVRIEGDKEVGNLLEFREVYTRIN